MDKIYDFSWILAVWQFQAALATGYMAYVVAYTGIRFHHKNIDIVFKIGFFALICSTIILSLSKFGKYYPLLIGFIVTIILAIVWRKIGIKLWINLLRKFDFSWSDDTPNAWVNFTEIQDYTLTQITVETIEGKQYSCLDPSKYLGLPFAPCVLGTNGDVVLYVCETRFEGVDKPRQHTIDEDYGATAQYFPCSQIKTVRIRRKKISKQSIFIGWRRFNPIALARRLGRRRRLDTSSNS